MHPYITETPLRIHLRNQLARLERVISGSDQPWSVASARRYHSRVRHYAECEPDQALVDLAGSFGANGIGPAIDDVCRHMEQAVGFEREASTGLIHCGEDRRAA
jgi:hypothetical protein